jgi:Skp family chaperone for outer membrane proteins
LKIDNTNYLLKKISSILKKFSTEKSISIILQKKNLVIGKTEFDITDNIIKIVDNEIEEFKIK